MKRQKKIPCLSGFGGLICLLATIALTAATNVNAASSNGYQGFFTVLDITGASPIDTSVFSQPVDGIFIRWDWADLEPQPDAYNFTKLDQAVRLSIENGKAIILGVGAGAQSPTWLLGAPYNVSSSNFIWSPHGGAAPCQNITVPWPWDPIYQQLFRNLVRDLAAHLRSIPGAFDDIVAVKITGLNIDNVQLQLPSSNGGLAPGGLCTESDAVGAWQRAGYTPNKIIATWNLFFAAFANAFPNQILDQSIIASGDFPTISNDGVRLNGPNDPGYVDVKQAFVTSALQAVPGRFAIDTTALTAYPQPPVEQTYGQQGAIMGYQANDYLGDQGGSGCDAASWFDTPTPCTSAAYEAILMNGVRLNARWIEMQPPNVSLFPNDVVRADIALQKHHP